MRTVRDLEAAEDFQAALERRGLGLDTYDAVQDLYDLLTYPIAEVDAFFQHLVPRNAPRQSRHLRCQRAEGGGWAQGMGSGR